MAAIIVVTVWPHDNDHFNADTDTYVTAVVSSKLSHTNNLYDKAIISELFFCLP